MGPTFRYLLFGIVFLFIFQSPIFGQFNHCFQLQTNVNGIYKTLFFNERDSFFSRCYCFAFGKQDGTYKRINDSVLQLHSNVNIPHSIIPYEYQKKGISLGSKFKLTLTDSIGDPLSNIPVGLVLKSTFDTLFKSTDSLGRIKVTKDISYLFLPYKSDFLYGNIFIRKELKRCGSGTIRLFKERNYVKWIYFVKLLPTGEYILEDEKGKKLTQLKFCEEDLNH